jgi:hypothetical protein
MSDSVETPEYPSLTGTTSSSHRAPGLTFELFRDGQGIAFVDIYVAGRRETYRISSKEFRQRLALDLSQRTRKPPAAAGLKCRIELLEGKALQPESPVREVYVRAACVGDRIYIDLGDASWSAIEIRADEWRIVQYPPVRFVRTTGMLPLPMPQSGGSLETLQTLINVRDADDFVLVVGWLLNALRGGGSHPILVLIGGEGTAKSTLLRILQTLIDPNCTPLGELPRTERELTTLASRRYVQPFDNVSAPSVRISNALCRLSTGAGARPIILNSIDDLVTRPDLADRCLFIRCDTIPEERRRPETELLDEFEKGRAQIFGVLLEALSYGLRILPDTKPDRLPRMADFALWTMACEGAFWAPGTFAAAYAANRAEAVEKLIGSDPVMAAIRRLAARRQEWTGTASELDQYLRVLTGNVDSSKAWPPDSPRLATRLRQLAPSLNKLGVDVSFSRSGHDRTRLITITTRTAKPDVQMSDKAAARIHETLPSAPSAVDPGQIETAAEDTEAKSESERVDDRGGFGRAEGADGADGADTADRPQ